MKAKVRNSPACYATMFVLALVSPHSLAPMVLLIVYSLTRVFASWKMVTGFSEEDWRKSIAGLYFDRAVDQA